eukprot:TCALIF_10480-PA protein Name:"Similar to Zscan20 Zinc finger and SCAN domain-containing protein 20 (Mus musculus)" AED:0.02 eAED:0.02 QI:105/0.85/0.75/1/0.71/0.62/8/401/760
MDPVASSQQDTKKGEGAFLTKKESKDNPFMSCITLKWNNFNNKQGAELYKKLLDRCETDCMITCGPIVLAGHQQAFEYASLRIRDAFKICLKVHGGKKCTKGYQIGLDNRCAPFIHELNKTPYPPQLGYVTIAEAETEEKVVIEVNVQRNVDKKPSSPVITPREEKPKPNNDNTSFDEILAKQLGLKELKKGRRSRKSSVPVRFVSQAAESNPTSHCQTAPTKGTGAVPKKRIDREPSRHSSGAYSNQSQSPPLPAHPYYNPVTPAMLPFLPPPSQYQNLSSPFQNPSAFNTRRRASSTVTSPSQTSSPSPTENLYVPNTLSLLQTAAAQQLSPLGGMASGSRQIDSPYLVPNASAAQNSLLLMGYYNNTFRNVGQPPQTLLQQVEHIKALEMQLGARRSQLAAASYSPTMQQQQTHQQQCQENEAVKNLLAAQFAANMRQQAPSGANAFPELAPGPSSSNGLASPRQSPRQSPRGANALASPKPRSSRASPFPAAGNGGALNLSRNQNQCQPKKGKAKSPKCSPKTDDDPNGGKRKRGTPPNYVRDENGEIVYSKSGKAKIRCEVCGRILTDPSSLYRHRKTHTDEKQHECKICFSKHIQRFNMKQHTVTHIGYPIDLSVINSMDVDLKGIMQGVRKHIKPDEFWKRVEKAKTKMRQAVIRQLARSASVRNSSITPETHANAFAELEDSFRRAEAVYGPTQAAQAAEDLRLAEAAQAEELAQFAPPEPMVVNEGAEEPSNPGTPEDLPMDAQEGDMNGE